MLELLSALLQHIFKTLASIVVVLIFLFFVGYLFIRLFGIDIKPYLNMSGRIFSGGRVIEFQEAFGGDSNIRVCDVLRLDADGDGFNEWLVYYQFDVNNPANWKQPCPSSAPMAAAIYDNDRGKPAILFPYKLQPPDRDFLGEGSISVDMQEIVPNYGVSTTDKIPELIFKGEGSTKYMTIFKYQKNTESWQPPTDDIPRYQVLGSFSGTGGVEYHPEDKTVVVYDRGPFERSQLAIKYVYKLHGTDANKTYMSEVGAPTLSAPVSSSIDFGINAPTDILRATYPEKIVLAFYQALTKSTPKGWNPADFLVPGSLAQQQLDKKNYAYFGFSGTGAPSNLVVRRLQYYPAAERLPTTPSIEGQQPVRGRVEIDAVAKQSGEDQYTGLISIELRLVAGQWKIESVTPVN